MADVPNEALRRHATGGFHLGLSQNHVLALVEIEAWKAGWSMNDTKALRGPRDHFIMAVRGLQERGLVEHDLNFDPHYRRRGKFESSGGSRPIRTYRVTKAGRLVRDLLKEAGVWQEFWAQLPTRGESEVAA